MTTTFMNNGLDLVMDWTEKYYTRQAEGKHGQRWINNRVNKVFDELLAISEAPDIELVKIKVSWKKSKTWGNCPHVDLEVFTSDGFELYKTYASGCGYDKESHAVGEAFNQCSALLRLLYNTDISTAPYGVNFYESGHKYGQGVGMCCYKSIADWLGAVWAEEHGNGWDFYSMTF